MRKSGLMNRESSNLANFAYCGIIRLFVRLGGVPKISGFVAKLPGWNGRKMKELLACHWFAQFSDRHENNPEPVENLGPLGTHQVREILRLHQERRNQPGVFRTRLRYRDSVWRSLEDIAKVFELIDCQEWYIRHDGREYGCYSTMQICEKARRAEDAMRVCIKRGRNGSWQHLTAADLLERLEDRIIAEAIASLPPPCDHFFCPGSPPIVNDNVNTPNIGEHHAFPRFRRDTIRTLATSSVSVSKDILRWTVHESWDFLISVKEHHSALILLMVAVCRCIFSLLTEPYLMSTTNSRSKELDRSDGHSAAVSNCGGRSRNWTEVKSNGSKMLMMPLRAALQLIIMYTVLVLWFAIRFDAELRMHEAADHSPANNRQANEEISPATAQSKAIYAKNPDDRSQRYVESTEVIELKDKLLKIEFALSRVDSQMIHSGSGAGGGVEAAMYRIQLIKELGEAKRQLRQERDETVSRLRRLGVEMPISGLGQARLSGVESIMPRSGGPCSSCSGTGRIVCGTCLSLITFSDDYRCPYCDGTRQCTCLRCNGSGIEP
jgi:hypothetical protein